MFEFLEQDLLVRIESVHMELDNLKELLEQKIDQSCQVYRIQVKSIEDQHSYLNTLKIKKQFPKMNDFLKNTQKISQDLRRSEKKFKTILSELTNFRASIKPLHRDRSIWLGKLSSTLKPLNFSDITDSRVKYVDLLDYTTNLTSMCSLNNDSEQIVVLDNYLNSLSLFDKEFNLIKFVCLNDMGNVRQARLTFNSNLYGITASSNYVYVNNSDRNQIVVLDKALNGIKSIFAPLKCKPSSSMFEVETYADWVYVFDNQNREVFR